VGWNIQVGRGGPVTVEGAAFAHISKLKTTEYGEEEVKGVPKRRRKKKLKSLGSLEERGKGHTIKRNSQRLDQSGVKRGRSVGLFPRNEAEGNKHKESEGTTGGTKKGREKGSKKGRISDSQESGGLNF